MSRNDDGDLVKHCVQWKVSDLAGCAWTGDNWELGFQKSFKMSTCMHYFKLV